MSEDGGNEILKETKEKGEGKRRVNHGRNERASETGRGGARVPRRARLARANAGARRCSEETRAIWRAGREGGKHAQREDTSK